MPTVIVEGKSSEIYLKKTLGRYSGNLASLVDCIESPGGWSDIDRRLTLIHQSGSSERVFVVWDQDILARPENTPTERLINHTPGFSFLRDFESAFPEWMLARALKLEAPGGSFPAEDEIRNARKECRKTTVPLYKHLQTIACAPLPSKVRLSKWLAEVANSLWYQPEEFRRLYRELEDYAQVPTAKNMIEDAVVVSGFRLNRSLIGNWRLRGRISLAMIPDLFVLDLNDPALECVVKGRVSGGACWDPTGTRLVIPSTPLQPLRNSEAVRILHFGHEISEDILRIGHNACWGPDARIYGNSLQRNGYQIHCGNLLKKENRRVVPVPRGAILACVDRKNSRLLIGEQGQRPLRVCTLRRIPDCEKVWDSRDTNLDLAEFSAGAVSPDGRFVSWPAVNGQDGESTSLCITDTESPESDSTKRVTAPEGYLRTSCWSPDGTMIAFVWKRWSTDRIRLWIYNTVTAELAPLVEGCEKDFDHAHFGALGCHAWCE